MTPREALYFIDNAADGGLGAPDYFAAYRIIFDALEELDKLRAEVEALRGEQSETLVALGIALSVLPNLAKTAFESAMNVVETVNALRAEVEQRIREVEMCYLVQMKQQARIAELEEALRRIEGDDEPSPDAPIRIARKALRGGVEE